MAIVGQGITAYPQPDDALNENSKNPVQNKVVAGNIKELKGKDTVQDERIAAMEQVTTATTIGHVAFASFDASAANMPLKGLTVDIEPVQAGEGDPSPENVRPITGWTGCKLHRTGVSLIGGDAFIGNTFAKTANGYELSYNGSGIANRGSGFADISGIPAGRYVLQFLNCSYPEGIEVAFRRRTDGTLTSVGTIIGSSTSGARAFDVPANTTELQFYIVPNSTVTIGDKVTMDDAILYRNGETAEPYKGNTYNITFPSEAGTVYGGTLDVVSGKMVVDRALLTVRDTDIASTSVAGKARRIYLSSAMYTIATGYPTDLKCNYYNNFPANYSAMQSVDMSIGLNRPQGDQIIIYDSSIDWTTDADFLARLQANPLQIVYPLATPIEYQLTQQEITTLIGTNNIWANRGDVTVTYGAYLETIKELVDKREMREEQVDGTVVNLNAEANTRYICGEVTTLDITLPVSGTCDIVFTSGSTPTVLTVPSTVKWMHGFDPTALAADTIYELNITDGLGVVASWT